jgi:3-hydroxyisobutyrate dehydrogenase-like beta-hydroxyacid dehydrogenase
MTTIAVMGAGLLGSGFVEGARSRGDDVHVWNRTHTKAKALESTGARAFQRAADAVRDVARVHLVVADDAAVDSILAQILPAARADTVIVDHSTTLPKTTGERVTRLAKQGVRFLHAPVFMAPANARDAKGMMLVSGPESVYRSVEGALAAMTGEVWYMGEQPHRAAGFKLLGNSMIITLAAGLADMFTIAQGAGISPADAIGLFAKFKVAGAIDVRGARMAKGDFRASFETTMARKDVRLMLETAAERPMAVLPGIAKRMDELIASGHGGDDLAVLAIDAIRTG